jgi:hypothetical protein
VDHVENWFCDIWYIFLASFLCRILSHKSAVAKTQVFFFLLTMQYLNTGIAKSLSFDAGKKP